MQLSPDGITANLSWEKLLTQQLPEVGPEPRISAKVDNQNSFNLPVFVIPTLHRGI